MVFKCQVGKAWRIFQGKQSVLSTEALSTGKPDEGVIRANNPMTGNDNGNGIATAGGAYGARARAQCGGEVAVSPNGSVGNVLQV